MGRGNNILFDQPEIRKRILLKRDHLFYIPWDAHSFLADGEKLLFADSQYFYRIGLEEEKPRVKRCQAREVRSLSRAGALSLADGEIFFYAAPTFIPNQLPLAGVVGEPLYFIASFTAANDKSDCYAYLVDDRGAAYLNTCQGGPWREIILGSDSSSDARLAHAALVGDDALMLFLDGGSVYLLTSQSYWQEMDSVASFLSESEKFVLLDGHPLKRAIFLADGRVLDAQGKKIASGALDIAAFGNRLAILFQDGRLSLREGAREIAEIDAGGVSDIEMSRERLFLVFAAAEGDHLREVLSYPLPQEGSF